MHPICRACYRCRRTSENTWPGAVKRALDGLDLASRIDLNGTMLSFDEFACEMVHHEAIHHGQWSVYASLGGFETPLSWRTAWRCHVGAYEAKLILRSPPLKQRPLTIHYRRIVWVAHEMDRSVAPAAIDEDDGRASQR